MPYHPKFSSPTVVNGKVYAAAFSNKLVAYGLLGGVPGNQPPFVNAGPDMALTLPVTAATLTGVATDDGLPSPPGVLTTSWSQVSGPRTVTFSLPNALSTTVPFSVPGTSDLRLSASDNAVTSVDDVIVTLNAPSRIL